MVHGRTIAGLVLPLLTSIAAPIAQTPPFEDEILKFEAQDKVKMPPKDAVLFTGSSSIRLWKTLAKDMPDLPVINRGFGGSQVSDSVRYADRIVTPYQPKVIVFFAGTNDLADGKSPETVLENFKAYMEKVRAKLPTVPVAYISISPAPSRWNNIKNVRKTNEMMKAYCEANPHLHYIDTYPQMVNNIGGPRVELYGPDNLHLNPKGYALWTEIIHPVVKELYEQGG